MEEIKKKKESPTIREVFGDDVNGLVYVKLRNKEGVLTIREPVKGLQIIKTEYLIEKEDEKK